MSIKRLSVACLLACVAITPVRAITINLSPAANNLTDHPDYDSNLAKIGAIMEAAATYWEGIFPQNHQIDIEYGYLDLSPAVLGVAVVNEAHQVTGRPLSGAIAFDTTVNSQILGDVDRDWFFDPTPLSNNEFDMQQTLVRDLTAEQRSAYYNGNPPDLLEAGYWGNYKGADLGDDAFTVALHEIGHILGVHNSLPFSNAELADGDYDFNSSWIHNQSAAAEYWDLPGDEQSEHLRSPESLMAVGAGLGNRHLPGATDIFAAAAVANWTTVDLYRMDFLGGTSWNVGTNWEGGTSPDDDDDAYVRHGGKVNINGPAVAGQLTIRDGSTVDTNANQLSVSQKIRVEAGLGGSDATLSVEPGGSVVAHELEINEGGNVAIAGSTVFSRVNASVVDINPGGVLLGHGRVSADKFYNNGTVTAINPIGDNVTAMRIDATGNNTIDLDGNSQLALEPGQNLGIEGSGKVFAVWGNLHVDGPLSDAFDGEMTVGAGRRVLFTQPWQLGDNVAVTVPTIELDGGPTEAEAASIQGAAMTANHGQINVQGFGRFGSHVDFEEGIDVHIASNSFLLVDGTATFRGGSYQGPGTMRLDTDTVIDESTTIDVASIDLDGDTGGPGTQITFDGATLRLNVDRIDSPGAANRYDGVMHVNGRFSKLDVRLNDPHASWQMNGVMNFNGSPLPGIMLDGSDVDMTGTMNVDGKSWVGANLDVSGTIALADNATELGLLQGPHIIRQAAQVTGPGAVKLLTQARVQLEDGAVVAAKVVNQGRLEPGVGIGQAQIEADYLQSGLNATFAVELGGTSQSDYDSLTIDAAADIGGRLEVRLADGGGGFFVPQVDDVFTVMHATGGLVDQFDSHDLPTHLGGQLFDWDVIYTGLSVVLQLDAIGGLLGDYNYDGLVDNGDFMKWQQTFGSTEDLMADGNQDGVVGDEDLSIWSKYLGASAGSRRRVLAGAVPEPLSALLVVCALAAFPVRSRRS
jgi:hypothetical protein